jgi:hypothetical protein
MLQIVSTTPAANAVDVNIALSEILIEFNQAIDPSTVTDMTVSVGIADQTPFVPLMGRVELYTDTTVRFVPDELLLPGKRYICVVTGGAFGIASKTGVHLANDYLFKFTAEADTQSQPQPGQSPSSGIPLDPVQLNTAASVDLLDIAHNNGSLILSFRQALPPDVSVSVTSRHPLGYPAGTDYWLNGLQPAVIQQNTITLSSTITGAATDLISSFVQIDSGITPMDGMIPVINYTDNGATVDFQPDLALNRIYEIKLTFQDSSSVTYSYLGPLAPSFITLEEVKYELRGIESFFNNTDDLRITIHLESYRAYRIWTACRGVNSFPKDRIPYYAKQYVLVRLMLAAVDYLRRNNAATGDVESVKLGDFTVSLGGNNSNNTNSAANSVDENTLKQLEYIYGQRLCAGDLSEKPLYEPSYSLMAPNHNYGTIGLVPNRGRIDPTYNPNFKRDLYYRQRTPDSYQGPEID